MPTLSLRSAGLVDHGGLGECVEQTPDGVQRVSDPPLGAGVGVRTVCGAFTRTRHTWVKYATLQSVQCRWSSQYSQYDHYSQYSAGSQVSKSQCSQNNQFSQLSVLSVVSTVSSQYSACNQGSQ